MIVGYGISIEGRIENCDRLILDGNMNCELSGLKALVISESGYFKGKGHVQQAEISGRFEGDLVVDGHIVIMQTGRVDGKITYKSIEIKPGGRFTGSIVLQESSPAKPAETDLLDRAPNGRMMAPSDKKEAII
jgi:cytoskeletal protein CcmA (bactofilin family)